MATASIGMRDSSSWLANEQPENWRQTILWLWPNGMAPLTALMSKMSSEQTDDATFHWFEKRLWDKGVDLEDDGVYEDAALTTAVSGSTNAASGTVVYAKVDTDFANSIREGHLVLLRIPSDHEKDRHCYVSSVDRSTGAVGCMLLESDASTDYLVNSTRFMIIGNSNPEGGARPVAISRGLDEFDNYTQIWRTSLSLTRTAMRTRYRTGNRYDILKEDALMDHSIEMEWDTLYGIKTLREGDNGQPERTTRGIVPFLTENYPDQVRSFIVDKAGSTWLNQGKNWLDVEMERSFRLGNSTSKLVLLGNAALLAIQRIVEANSDYRISVNEVGFGIKVVTLTSVFGEWHLKTHPLMTKETSTNAAALVLEPKNLNFKYIDDTDFLQDEHFGKGGGSGTDGKEEEFLTEGGYEIHHGETFSYLQNFGVDG